jgi:FKBP-type peptidyl-prolyl cis-trans isomerase 2
MTLAKQGDTVKVHYTGKLEDGTVFDTSQQREPIQFTIGEQTLIPGFERAVVGLSPGESKNTKIAAEEAYGPRREELVVVVERDRLPEDVEPAVGLKLQMHQPDGQVIPARVVELSDANVKLDANHPLAGQDLTFDLELVEIV